MDRLALARRLGAEPHVEEPGGTPVVVMETDPARFMAAFAAATAGGGPVFLGDPTWSATQRAEVERLLAEAPAARAGQDSRGWLMIPSGGTSGKLKFARHDEETLMAAVRGFCAHFAVNKVNAVGVLPLYHVSGFMAWMRCVVTGGTYVPWDWKRLEAGENPTLANGDWVVSLVPTQLQRLLASPTALDWLRPFRSIFVGGGPVWPALTDAAARAGLRISLGYGATETAAMVTALRPEEFLAGARSSGTPLSHARVRITEEGVIAVAAESLFRGYWPERCDGREWVTDDLGAIDNRGHLCVLGRRDAVIITGGRKVQPANVEAALRASGQFDDVVVVGMPDAEWGEAVVAAYCGASRTPDFAAALAALMPHERPKRFVRVDEWPRNAQGKVDRARLRERLFAG